MEQLFIKNDKPIQDNFWGNGAVYHGYAGMPDDAGRVYSDELCELEAKRIADMRLKFARTFYGWWAWDPKTKTWDWENEYMRPFYRWLKRMKDAGVAIALNTGWCSPGDINSTSWNGESPFTVEGDWEKSKQNYADWVSETIYQLIELRGFTNIKVFVMFTEPQHLSGISHEGKDAYTCWAETVKTVHETLKRDGRRDKIKLMGPNEGSTTTSEMLHWVAENCDEYIDIYSSHTYLFTRPLKKEDYITGNASVTISIPGGRFSRKILLEPNTKYEVIIDAKFVPNQSTYDMVGEIAFGVFEDRPNEQKCGFNQPLVSACENSILAIPATAFTEEFKRYSFSFTSENAVIGNIGVFHDIKTYGTLFVDKIILRRNGEIENLLDNGDFSDHYEGWNIFFAGATIDANKDWTTWAKTGMQYVPNGKPFCFDEYNAIYNRDNSRINHGAEIVNAAVAFMNCGVQSSLLWTVFDQVWPSGHTTNNDSFFDGDHRCGTMSVLARTKVPHLSYYAFGLLSRYVDGEGTKVFKGIGVDQLNTTMSISKDGEITIVVVNDHDCKNDFNLKLEIPINRTLRRHRFDPANCIPDEKATLPPADADFDIADSIIDSIAPYGVSVYTTHND